MEKKGGRLRGAFLIIALLSVVVVGWYVYRAGEGRRETYKAAATGMLKEALVQEMDARPEIKPYIGHIGKIRLWDSSPKKLIFKRMSAKGAFQFSFSSSELRNNIVGTEKGIDGTICSLHSEKLFEKPMDADTLYQRWRHLLPFSQRTELGLRMSYTDLHGEQTTTYVPNTGLPTRLDSLCMWSVGSWCELKVTAYAALPDWWQWLAWWEWMFPIIPLACLALLYSFRSTLYQVGNRLLVREKLVEKVVTQVREVEKVVYVKSAAPSQEVKTYQIGGDLYFQPQSGKLWNDKLEKTLSPQPTALLQTFLEAKDYKVEKQYLIDKFWPKRANDPTHTLHNAISRLRKETEGLLNITSNAQSYQLEIP